MGRLLGRIEAWLEAAASRDPDAPRLVLLSGHDSTLVPLLAALQVGMRTHSRTHTRTRTRAHARAREGNCIFFATQTCSSSMPRGRGRPTPPTCASSWATSAAVARLPRACSTRATRSLCHRRPTAPTAPAGLVWRSSARCCAPPVSPTASTRRSARGPRQPRRSRPKEKQRRMRRCGTRCSPRLLAAGCETAVSAWRPVPVPDVEPGRRSESAPRPRTVRLQNQSRVRLGEIVRSCPPKLVRRRRQHFRNQPCSLPPTTTPWASLALSARSRRPLRLKPDVRVGVAV